jgi:hypothetical protein
LKEKSIIESKENKPVTGLKNLVNVSIVRYKQPFQEIAALVSIIRQSTVVGSIYIVDNSPEKEEHFYELDAQYIFNNANWGYGKAHNIAIKKSICCNAKYHLVVNSDIQFAPIILEEIVTFLDNEQTVGALMPKIYYPNGKIQHLCKLLPTPSDLLFRRFLPVSWTKKQANRFELIGSGYNKIMNIPYLSGCFMMLRVEALKKVGLFDEQFFLYPEDIDLSRRIHEEYETVFFPMVNIIHSHEQGSYKNLRLFLIHIINLIRYFNKWGWIFDKKRKSINKATLDQISKLLNNNTKL